MTSIQKPDISQDWAVKVFKSFLSKDFYGLMASLNINAITADIIYSLVIDKFKEATKSSVLTLPAWNKELAYKVSVIEKFNNLLPEYQKMVEDINDDGISKIYRPEAERIWDWVTNNLTTIIWRENDKI